MYQGRSISFMLPICKPLFQQSCSCPTFPFLSKGSDRVFLYGDNPDCIILNSPLQAVRRCDVELAATGAGITVCPLFVTVLRMILPSLIELPL